MIFVFQVTDHLMAGIEVVVGMHGRNHLRVCDKNNKNIKNIKNTNRNHVYSAFPTHRGDETCNATWMHIWYLLLPLTVYTLVATGGIRPSRCGLHAKMAGAHPGQLRHSAS